MSRLDPPGGERTPSICSSVYLTPVPQEAEPPELFLQTDYE